MPDKDDVIAAMYREAAGYDNRRKIAEEELKAGVDDPIRKITLERIVEECIEGKRNALAELDFYGHKAKPPAKRAEKRPAPKKVTR